MGCGEMKEREPDICYLCSVPGRLDGVSLDSGGTESCSDGLLCKERHAREKKQTRAMHRH